MKKQLHILLAIVMVIPMLCMANPDKKTWDYEKTKKIKKEYNVNANALLRINNKYGNVDVISWDQNRIEIEVTIPNSTKMRLFVKINAPIPIEVVMLVRKIALPIFSITLLNALI